MSAPRLTPHQADTLRRLVKRHRATMRPVPVADFGSRWAVDNLAGKGYVSVTTRTGPRGGTSYYAEPIYANLPRGLASSTVFGGGAQT